MSTIRCAQCALYQLGYNAQSLLAIAEDYWFVPQHGLQFPEARSSALGEIVVAADLAASCLSGAIVDRVREIPFQADQAWSSLREEWHSDDHRNVVDQLQAANELPLDDNWWDATSPLSTEPFNQLRESLQGLRDELNDGFSIYLEAGRVVSQAVAIPYNRVEQDRRLGERFPFPRLRQLLGTLRATNQALRDLDFHIPESHSPSPGENYPECAKRQAQAAHQQILQALIAASSDHLETDPRRPDRSAESQPGPRRSPPSREAYNAWRAYYVAGVKQTDLARTLGKSQGTVSRWIKQTQEYIDQHGILPEYLTERANRERAMDPSIIDQGPRLDPRDPRPSDIGDDD